MAKHVTRNRWPAVIIGLVFIGAGAWLTYQIFFQGIMSVTASPAGLVFMLGPACFFFGLTAAVRGLLLQKKAFSGRNVLYCGLLMAVIGIYPALYTPLLIGGRDPETAQWLGRFIRISTGYPGMLLVVVGLFIRNKNN